MVGHLLGAAGALEFVTCVKELEEGYIHKTVGYTTPDEEIDLDYCKEPYEEILLTHSAIPSDLAVITPVFC